MQNGVEHPVRPLHAPSGQLPNSLEDGVAVAVLFGQDRQDDRGRGSGYQVLVDLHDFTRRAALTNSNSSVHSSIIHGSARYINPQSGRPAAGGEIDVRRVPFLGIHNGETLSELPGLDELTSARVLGRLLYAVDGASFKPSSRTASRVCSLCGSSYTLSEGMGRQSTLWTLKDAAEVSFEEGLTNELVSGETVELRFRGWECAGSGPSAGSRAPIHSTAEKRGSRPADTTRPEPSTVGFGLRGRDLVFSLRATCSGSWSDATKPPIRLLEKEAKKDDPDPKALSCYGLYLPELKETWLRFVDGDR